MSEHLSEPLWEALLYQLGELTAEECAEFERRAGEQDEVALTLSDAMMLHQATHAALDSLPTTVSAGVSVTKPVSAAPRDSRQARAGGWAAAAACLVCLMMALALRPQVKPPGQLAEFQAPASTATTPADSEFPYELLWPAETTDGAGPALGLLSQATAELEPFGLDEGLKTGLIADMGDVPGWMLAAVTVDDDPDMPQPERPQ